MKRILKDIQHKLTILTDALREEEEELAEEDIKTYLKHAVRRMQNDHPLHLSKDDVLQIFLQYVGTYYGYCSSFAIPVGKKYAAYAGYVRKHLTDAYPDITWSLMYETDDKFVCSGKKS